MDVLALIDWIGQHRDTLAWLGGGVVMIVGGRAAVLRWPVVRRWPVLRRLLDRPDERQTSDDKPEQSTGEDQAMADVPASPQKLAEDYVDQLFKADDFVGISTGLALGYFNNFLKPVLGELLAKPFNIQHDTHPSRRVEKPANVDINIIIPAQLSGATFQRCEERFNSYRKGRVTSEGHGRVYGINYAAMDNGQVMIFDLARPVMAVKVFYEEMTNIMRDPRTRDKWPKIEKAEIEAFKMTLERLKKAGMGELVNKLNFVDI